MEILTEQVAIVDELTVQMKEQDELIGELELLIRSDKEKQVGRMASCVKSRMLGSGHPGQAARVLRAVQTHQRRCADRGAPR